MDDFRDIKNGSLYVNPGDLCFSLEPRIYRTVLGSCISVCLHDGRLKRGGINHFMYAEYRDNGEADDKFGDPAIRHLIEEMLKAGSDPADLKAFVAGGASSLSRNLGPSVGDRNAETALRLLSERKISVWGRETGGCRGRELYFDPTANRVDVTPLDDCLAGCGRAGVGCRFRIKKLSF